MEMENDYMKARYGAPTYFYIDFLDLGSFVF
jgi:hypothetical protein